MKKKIKVKYETLEDIILKFSDKFNSIKKKLIAEIEIAQFYKDKTRVAVLKSILKEFGRKE